MPDMSENKASFLLIEDNLADQEMTRRALSRVNPEVELVVVDDGEQAMDYLLRRDVYSDANTPDLVLLDLNLPRLSGQDLIRQIREHDDLRHLPVIVLTTSHAHEDVVESYRLGANSYLIKPSRFDLFISVMEDITKYWLTLVRLPRGQ